MRQLLENLLRYDPTSRIGAEKAHQHSVFKTYFPTEIYDLPHHSSIFECPNIKLTENPGNQSLKVHQKKTKRRQSGLF